MNHKLLIGILTFFLFLMSMDNMKFVQLAYGGECLQSRQEMLNDYKEAISSILQHSDQKDYYLGPWIEYCWDPSSPNDEINQELGKFILSVLENPRVPNKVRIRSLNIARNAALSNVYPKMVHLLKRPKSEEEQGIVFETLLNIWSTHAANNSEIAQYDYIRLFKENVPGQFPPAVKVGWLCEYYWAMGKVYIFDYPAAKKILIDNDFFKPSECHYGKTFQDPRAFEDAAYMEHNHKAEFSLNYSALFSSLIRHLELEFKRDWLTKLGADQLRMLRNGILATYGWKFKDQKLKYLFNESLLRYFCRNGKCGKVSNNYNDNLLTDIDKKNIALIQEVEKNAPLTYTIIDPSRFPAPPPRLQPVP